MSLLSPCLLYVLCASVVKFFTVQMLWARRDSHHPRCGSIGNGSGFTCHSSVNGTSKIDIGRKMMHLALQLCLAINPFSISEDSCFVTMLDL